MNPYQALAHALFFSLLYEIGFWSEPISVSLSSYIPLFFSISLPLNIDRANTPSGSRTSPTRRSLDSVSPPFPPSFQAPPQDPPIYSAVQPTRSDEIVFLISASSFFSRNLLLPPLMNAEQNPTQIPPRLFRFQLQFLLRNFSSPRELLFPYPPTLLK